MPWPLCLADPAPRPPRPASPEAALGTVADHVEDPVDPALAHDAALPPRRESVADEVNATLLVLLPWGISALLHAGVVLLAVFVVWTVVLTAQDHEVIVPVLELSTTPDAPLRVQTQQRIQTQERQRSPTPQPTPAAPTQTIDLPTALIGLSGPAPDASPFAVDAAAPQLQSSFMGNRGGNARRIVFLIDASGSLADSLQFVIEGLQKSIRKLSDQQRFTVIFFNGKREIIQPPGGLEAATLERKQFVMSWIELNERNVWPELSGNPIPALQHALSYRPQLIYLLSNDMTGRGKFEMDQDKLLSEFRRVNRDGVKINTIQFLDRDLFELRGQKGTLERIAEESGGNFRFVSAEELKIK